MPASLRPRATRARLASLALLAAAVLAAGCRTGAGPQPGRSQRVRDAEAMAQRAVREEQSLRADTLPVRTVGVTPFDVRGADSTAHPLAYGLADLLITDLSRSAQLEVVDRVRVDALLRELQLTAAGATDEATAPRVGKLVGARRLVVGGLSTTPDGELRLELSVIDAVSGQVGARNAATTPLDRILDAEKALAFRIFDLLGVTLSPAERAAVEQRPTANIGALLAYSRAVRSEALGDFAGAETNYNAAVFLDPSFQAAAQRLDAIKADAAGAPAAQGGRTTLAARPATSLRRAGLAASLGVTGIPSIAGGPADAAFPGALSTVIVVTVSTPAATP